MRKAHNKGFNRKYNLKNHNIKLQRLQLILMKWKTPKIFVE